MKKIIVSAVLVYALVFIWATTMVVHTTNGEETFELSEIESITFAPDVDVVFQDDFNEWNSNDWSGNWWNYNNNQGTWQPNVDDGVAYMQTTNYSWGQIRLNELWSPGHTFTVDLTPYLQSGGSNYDGAFLALSDNWVDYLSEYFIGIQLKAGNIYVCNQDEWEIENIGSYVAGEINQLTINWNIDGSFTISSSTGSYTTETNVLPINNAYFVIANKDSSDGFELDQIIITE
jgi:hypothetical protein